MKIEKCKISKYPEIAKEIERLKIRGYGLRTIKELIISKYGVEFSHQTISNYLDTREGTATLIAEADIDLKKDALEYQNILNQRFDRIVNITNGLMDKIEQLQEDLSTEEFVKYAPKILAVCREVLNQLEFIKGEQAKIVVNQQNVIYSPIQINMEIRKILPKLLTDFEKQGIITINKNIF